MVDRPRRIQRKRAKGWKMPPNTVYVGRPGLFGNPIDTKKAGSAKEAVRLYRKFLRAPQSWLVENAGDPMAGLYFIAWREKVKRELVNLRGKNLACWCPEGQPCHADVLLELANK